MDSYVLKYHGLRKISALRSVRRFTGLTLYEAKNAIEETNGFIVLLDTADRILKDYLVTGIDAGLSGYLDWSVELFTLPLDLRPIVAATPPALRE